MDFYASNSYEFCDSLSKYQRNNAEIDSGFGSGFESSCENFDQGLLNVCDTNESDVIKCKEEDNLLKILKKEFNTLEIKSTSNSPEIAQIFQYLIDAFTPDDDNDTYLHILLAKNEVRNALQLIDICPESCYLDIQNNLGQAGIHVAAYLNIAVVVHRLIMKGALIDVVDNEGQNIFHICADRGYQGTLIAICDAAQRTNQLDKVWKLVQERDYSGFTSFFLAVSKKHINICRLLAKMNTNLQITDGHNGNSALHEAIIPDDADPKFVKFLLDECKLNVNYQNFNGVTPLHVAASKNNTAFCSLLLLHRANVNVTDMMGFFPVDYASNKEIIGYLQNK